MIGLDTVSPTRLAILMEEALQKRVRERLKAPLMKIAEKEVDAAVEEAVKEMNVRAHVQHKDPRMGMHMETVEFILTRREENQ